MKFFLEGIEMFNKELLGFKEFVDIDNIVVFVWNWGEFLRWKYLCILKLN